MKNTPLFNANDENFHTVYCNKDKDKILVYYLNDDGVCIEYTIYTLKGVEIDGGCLDYTADDDGVFDENEYTLEDLCEYVNFDAHQKLSGADDIVEIIDEIQALQIKLHVSLLTKKM